MIDASSTAIKYPNRASSIAFQSPGFTDGIIDDTELPEELLGNKSVEVSKDAEELSEDEHEIESEEVKMTCINTVLCSMYCTL